MAKQGISLVTCDYMSMLADAIKLPVYHLKHIAPAPQEWNHEAKR